MRFLSLALVVLCLALAGCDADPLSGSLGDDFLPSEAQYDWTFEARALDPDSLLIRQDEEVRVRTLSREASVESYDGLVEVEARIASAQKTWYEMTADRLTEVAYSTSRIGAVLLPRSASASPAVYGTPRIVREEMERLTAARGGASDSLIVRDDPRVVYELPLEVGSSWVSFTEPFESTREVIRQERITVAAGTFESFVVRTRVSIIADEEFEWLDYVSPEHGLVLRTTRLTGTYRDSDNTETNRPMRSVERLELTAVQ